MKRAASRGVCLVLALLAPGCSSEKASGPVSLRQQYADYFPIGAAVNPTTYTTHAGVLTTHFNSITTENEMKFYALEPVEGQFSYDAADTQLLSPTRRGTTIFDPRSGRDLRSRGHAPPTSHGHP